MEICSIDTISLVWVIFYSILGWLNLFHVTIINYGRMSNSFVRIYLPPSLAWFFFEIPNLLWVGYFLIVEKSSLNLGFCLFIIHYINRCIVYPLRMNTKTKVPFQITLMAFTFTTANGYLQSKANSNYLNYGQFWYIGLLLFFGGMAINIYSDSILQKAKEQLLSKQYKKNIEEPKQTKQYKKIDKFLFRYIGSPNYFGQIIQWFGYWIVCGHWQSFLFAFSTASILIPAAIARHRWNVKNIADYPLNRKAIFPILL